MNDLANIPAVSFRPCDVCGTEFKVRRCEVRKAQARGCHPPRYCSRACQHQAYAKEGNPKWRGGRCISSSGYVLVHAPDHPHQNKGYVLEHRLVMERHLGHVIDKTQPVHHINHDRTDNRIENLQLMESWSAHQAHHGKFALYPCDECGNPVRRSAAHRRRRAHAFCSKSCAAAYGCRANAAASAARKATR